LALVASARTRLRHGQWDKARQQLTVAARLTPALTSSLPWLALQVRLELGHAYVTLRDRTAAQRVLEEARGILAASPALGLLADEADRLDEEIAGVPPAPNGSNSGLTAAELRVLPLLSTHLSFREIGERLYVSRNTIKTQAISVYRKLGVSNRSEAVARARELGLVEAVSAPETQVEATDALRSVAS
jgi:LuxR family maltose regulon positive regulatory protein